MSDDKRTRFPGGEGLEYLGEANLGPVGPLLAHSRSSDPLKGFNPDAFAEGAYEETERAEAAERAAGSGKAWRRWRFWR